MAPSASPGRASALELGAAAEDDGTPKLGSHKNMDTLELLSVNRPIGAITMATPDLPPHSASPPSVTNSDEGIAGRSLKESSTKHTEHRSPDPSRCQYDIV
jgi:hypothetical protein